ncbi:CDP-glycerol:poly(glycerophosphate) glycerophosphotransferase [Chromatocurvus halotolerans]|uniref:CDP-glycerol:poly(Glycerophosphate) glycerophosphotransferase n=1 Tax=Chromatocurvus halotolerans TaxID=1132028 RepID=A0A4R2KU24_9GAMM|nr:CDP-glycerol:poly(glycerophosphate) glycerophosphotransferase [Chromatocurvus halotolerans]
MRSTTRIAFFFNHVAAHQVYHGAPLAFQLSLMAPHLRVVIISASLAIEETVHRIARLYPGHRVSFARAHVPWLVRVVTSAMRPVKLAEKDAIRWFSRRLFRKFDVVVVPEANSLKLRGFPELSNLKLVYTHHGAGDRSIGFDERHKEFDLILCPGSKIRDRLAGELGIPVNRLAVTGYPKFDVVDQLDVGQQFFKDDKPVVLYNPHFSNRESSWRQFGMQVLEFFADQDEYNLIFAPHVLLYARGLRHGARSLRRFFGHPRLHVDTGSTASFDMTYTRAADIYLGDVSSQVYEFVRCERPCIFIDAGASEDPANRVHQRMGEVIGSLQDLPEALASAADKHQRIYCSVQRELLRSTFDEADVPATERGARAIIEWLEDA